ncbi:MAG: 50S ribosomal protein L17 [Candidatus Omnitrophota bacterium]
MRHRRRTQRLSRNKAERAALLLNLVRGLFTHQRIETTIAKAKEARRLADRLITFGKEDNLNHRRFVFAILRDRDVVTKLFKEIAPLFKNRNGGYTRTIRSGVRKGDGAQLAILELTEKKIVAPKVKPKREKAVKEKPSEEIEKAAPKEIPLPVAGKPKEILPPKHIPPKKEREIKPTQKTPTGFLGTLRKFFKGRTK